MSKQLVPTTPDQKGKGRELRPDSGWTGEAEKRPSAAQIAISVLPEVLLLATAAGLFLLARGFDQPPEPGQLGPAFWPQVLCVGIAVCSVARLAQKLRGGGRAVPAGAGDEDEPETAWSKIALVIALVVGYVLGMVFLGYVLATALFFAAFAYLGGQRRWYVAPLGLASSLVFAYVFLKVVYISLPSGVGVFDQFSVLVYQMLGIY